MKILGLQKMTLLDYPSKVACTVFLGGCNFRCPFCHNASVVFMADCEEISKEELFAFLKKRQGLLDGVCITGGEPLINDDIYDFMREIRAMGYLIKLDTNGSFPEKLKYIIDEKTADYIAMDIKSSPESYSAAAGVDTDIDKINKSIDLIMSCGIPYEFRTTVVKGIHTAEDFAKIGERIKGARAYYLQTFKDSGNLIGGGFESFSAEEMSGFKNLLLPYVPNTQIRE